MYFHEVIKAVVKHDLGIKHHDHVNAAKHLEHFFVQIEINGADRLRISAFKIKDDLAFIAPHRALNTIGAHTETVITDVVLKMLLLLGYGVLDQFRHGTLVTGQ